jgi:ATP-dependent DNA helicase RecQ
MLNYASRFRQHCFRSFILGYFGEWNRTRNCENCSRCSPDQYRDKKAGSIVKQVRKTSDSRPEPPRPVNGSSQSSTTVALKILSCVLRVEQKLGREKVARILAGSEDTSIRDYRNVSTYGLLSDYSIRSVTGMIDYLISENYIAQENGFRPSIHLTAKGRAFLKEKPEIQIPGV